MELHRSRAAGPSGSAAPAAEAGTGSETAEEHWRKHCMKRLFVYSCPQAWGFCSIQEYSRNLGGAFPVVSDKEVWLEAEECSDHCKDTSARLKRYFIDEPNRFYADTFRKVLFNGFEPPYRPGICDPAKFSKRRYRMRNLPPDFLDHDQPF